jgi:hypothetical protein
MNYSTVSPVAVKRRGDGTAGRIHFARRGLYSTTFFSDSQYLIKHIPPGQKIASILRGALFISLKI